MSTHSETKDAKLLWGTSIPKKDVSFQAEARNSDASTATTERVANGVRNFEHRRLRS